MVGIISVENSALIKSADHDAWNILAKHSAESRPAISIEILGIFAGILFVPEHFIRGILSGCTLRWHFIRDSSALCLNASSQYFIAFWTARLAQLDVAMTLIASDWLIDPNICCPTAECRSVIHDRIVSAAGPRSGTLFLCCFGADRISPALFNRRLKTLLFE